MANNFGVYDINGKVMTIVSSSLERSVVTEGNLNFRRLDQREILQNELTLGEFASDLGRKVAAASHDNWEYWQNWTFDVNTTGSRGDIFAIESPNVVFMTGSSKFGTSCVFVEDVSYTQCSLLSGLTGWTISAWIFQHLGADWDHFVVSSDGEKWYNGSRDDSVNTDWFSVTGSNVRLTAGAGNNPMMQVDDLVFAPNTKFPGEFIQRLYSSGLSFRQTLSEVMLREPPSWVQANTGIKQGYVIYGAATSYSRATNTFVSASSVI